MNNIIVVLIGILCCVGLNAKAQDPNTQALDLGNAYYEKGEYEKAVESYKKILKDPAMANSIHTNYLQTVYKLKNWDEAADFLKKQLKNNPNQIIYEADWIDYLNRIGKKEEAQKAQKQLIEKAAEEEGNVFALQNYYYQINDYETLITLLENARKKSKTPERYSIQLARAYLLSGNKMKMLEEVLTYGMNSNNLNYVKATIQDNFREEEDIKELEQYLYTKIQDEPNNPYYSELLIWNFVRQKKFKNAFIQAKALDKRLHLMGQKVFEIAGIAYQNKDYKAASTMYEYLKNEYADSEIYPYARRWLIQSKEEIIKNTYPIAIDDIRDLIQEYEKLIDEVGVGPKTLEVMRNVALLKAFYLDEHDNAIAMLEKAIEVAGANQYFKDECKIDLGDIYILKNEPWESTLLYLQVEKSQKEDKLGEIAKLKNAKNYYYRGDFYLAKEILDILKKATTREIANDAMQLSLIIEDNTGLDTSTVAMEEYASIDLLVFQNKNEQAIKALDSMFTKYSSHSLADEILWLRGNTYLKINKVEEAVKDLTQITQDYKEDILADDALFTLAEIYEQYLNDKSTAMKLYRQLLQDYPGSIYGVEARKHFRSLRGDYIN